MSTRIHRLTIPVKRWSPQDQLPSDATAAVGAAGLLRLESTTIDEISLTGAPLSPLNDTTAFRVTAAMRCAQAPRTFRIAVRVFVEPLNDDGEVGPALTVRVTTTWTSPAIFNMAPEVAETFARSLGGLDPIAAAAGAVARALKVLGITAKVTPSPTLEFNRRAVMDLSSLPPMSSDDASPLNPYGLEGVAGSDAEVWQAHRFPPAVAGPWASAGFDAESGITWIRSGYAVEAAAPWFEVGVDPVEARGWEDAGVGASDLVEAEGLGVHPEEYLHLVRSVTEDEIPEWVAVIEEYDLLGAVDVAYLVKSGVAADDVWRARRDLTAVEIVRYCLGDDETELDDDHLDLGDGPGVEFAEAEHDEDERFWN